MKRGSLINATKTHLLKFQTSKRKKKKKIGSWRRRRRRRNTNKREREKGARKQRGGK